MYLYIRYNCKQHASHRHRKDLNAFDKFYTVAKNQNLIWGQISKAETIKHPNNTAYQLVWQKKRESELPLKITKHNTFEMETKQQQQSASKSNIKLPTVNGNGNISRKIMKLGRTLHLLTANCVRCNMFDLACNFIQSNMLHTQV